MGTTAIRSTMLVSRHTMKVTFVLLLIALLAAEYQCRRGGGGGRGRGSSGSKTRSHGSSGGGFWSWLGFGGSKSSSSSHSKLAPAASPSAPKSPPNNYPIGFEHFGQDGNRHVYDQNNKKFASNTYQSGPHNYGFNKDNKLNSGRIVPVQVPIPIGGGSSYHHYYHNSDGSHHYQHDNITTGTDRSTTGTDPVHSLNPGFLDPDSLYFPYKPGYLFPTSRNEDPNGTLWKTRSDLFLRKYGKHGNHTSLTTPTPVTL